MLRLIFLFIYLGCAYQKADWNDHNIILYGSDWVHPDPIDPDAPKPHPPYDDRWKTNTTSIIFLIASFRETRCPKTLYHLFSKAGSPDRIWAGIVQQNQDSDPDCVEGYCKLMEAPLDKKDVGVYENNNNCPHYDRILITRLKDTDAKGPVYARGLGAELVDEEKHDFVMQIDAHTDALPDWDRLMLDQWGAAENEFAVLTTYPTNHKDLGKNSNNHWEMPHLCQASIVGKGQVRNAQARAAANLDRPILAPLWAAGLSFSRSHAEVKVPNDVHLLHVFNGEEFGRGSRLWTWGYDFYTITRPIIGTYYGSEKGGRGWWRSVSSELKESNERLATLLRFPGSDQSPEAIEKLGRYNLGPKRTLEQYVEFTGVDTINRKVAGGDSHCIVYYVPWDDSDIKEQHDRLGGKPRKKVVEPEPKIAEPEKKLSEENHKIAPVKPVNLAKIQAASSYGKFSEFEVEMFEFGCVILILGCFGYSQRRSIGRFLGGSTNSKQS